VRTLKIILTAALALLQIPALVIPLLGVMCSIPLFLGDNDDGIFTPTASLKIYATVVLLSFLAIWAVFLYGTLHALIRMWGKRHGG